MKYMIKKMFYYVKPILILFCSLFFERKYISGRHFEDNHNGLIWALRSIWMRNVLRLAPPAPWPMALTCIVSNPKNIYFHPDNLDNFISPGTYFQNFMGCIHIGYGTYIAPNVGIITANHNLEDLDKYEKGKDVIIGEKCWIGMNAVILPGVTLGPGTIVAAGAVVSKSFPEGRVVIGGVPAKILKHLDTKKFENKIVSGDTQ